MNILVLCTGNSARSILLEAILNHAGAGRVRAWSAGSRPAGAVHPEALRLLSRHGIDTDGPRSKSWDEFALPGAPQMDLVVTVCGNAAAEQCPFWPGAPVRAHWGVDDPAAAAPAARSEAFARCFDILSARAEAFLAAPIERMDRAALSAHAQSVAAVMPPASD